MRASPNIMKKRNLHLEYRFLIFIKLGFRRIEVVVPCAVNGSYRVFVFEVCELLEEFAVFEFLLVLGDSVVEFSICERVELCLIFLGEIIKLL